MLSGGGGQRKPSLIPMDADGHSGQQLRSASNNGKIVLFLVPLQENMETEGFENWKTVVKTGLVTGEGDD